MNASKLRSLFVAGLVAVAVVGPQASTTVNSAPALQNEVLARALDIELGHAEKGKAEQLVSSGALYAVLQATGQLDQRAKDAKQKEPKPLSRPGTQGCQNTFAGEVSNVKVNQDCSLRRQAEETIVANPTDPDNLVAGQNDSRIGFNHCGYDWSFDGGKTWGDQLPPFYQFVLRDGHTADACSDPTAAFDAQGNAYVGGILFDVVSAANAIVVEKSNAPIGGAFYHTPAHVAFQTYLDNPLGVVANDISPAIFNDKELMTADAHPGSPKANNVYMTWTRFNGSTRQGVGGNSPIDFSQSTDGGAHWSAGIEISGRNPRACTIFSGEADANACDQDQGSHPIVGADGTIYVAFGNGNTPLPGINQHMIVSCPPTADCSMKTSWTAPVKISDDFGTQPFGPNPSTGCPGGRQCLPPNGYRLDDFVEGSVSVDNAGNLYFVWADFRNGGGSCPPLSLAATATPPCNNDVFYALSTDRGATWSAARNLTSAPRFGQTAQWQPWSAVTPNGKTLWVAFYDREYGTCETDGCNDITLAQVNNPTSGSPNVRYDRLTTSSMPNLVPANNPAQAGFLGDYMWVAIGAGDKPLVVWADTRGRDGAVEEDVYFAR